MSSTFSKNRKELAGVKLLSANDVWENIGNTGKVRLKRGLKFFGKIDRKIPNFVLKANNPTAKTEFVDDTSSLPAATKKKVVDYFMNDDNSKKRVVYLVRCDKDFKK